MSFHGHSCPSIMIICIQRKHVRAVADAGMACPVFFFFFEQLGWCPPGSWCPKQLRTLRIGSGGGTGCLYTINISAVKMND